MPSSAPLPLAGLRILAPTQLGAGPFGLMFLADLGAEIVKVENPATRGDESRTIPPFNDVSAHDGLYFQALNRGARSLTLNLRHPDGQALLHRLVPRFDAVFNNLRGDQTEKLGLDYATLGPLHPRLVCCSLSGFGRTGPRRDEPAYDYLLQAYAGFMSITGEPDAPPTKAGVSIVDFSGGILAALALMIALYRARATGQGATSTSRSSTPRSRCSTTWPRGRSIADGPPLGILTARIRASSRCRRLPRRTAGSS